VQPTLRYFYRHLPNILLSLKNAGLLILFLQIPVTCYPLIHNYFPAPFPNTLNLTLLPHVTVYVISHFIIIFRLTHTLSILLSYILIIHQRFFRSLFGPYSRNPLDDDICVLWKNVVCLLVFFTKWTVLYILLLLTSVVVGGILVYKTLKHS
jgi:hypothetical protein